MLGQGGFIYLRVLLVGMWFATERPANARNATLVESIHRGLREDR